MPGNDGVVYVVHAREGRFDTVFARCVTVIVATAFFPRPWCPILAEKGITSNSVYILLLPPLLAFILSYFI